LQVPGCCGRFGCPDSLLSDAEVFPFLANVFETHGQDLVCLSWAASVLQQYKHTSAGPTSFGCAVRTLDKQRGTEIVGAKVWIDAMQ
jgi:hypothetical protein